MARNPNRSRWGDYPNFGTPIFASKVQGATWTIHLKPKASAIELAARSDDQFIPPTGPLLLAKGDSRDQSVEVYPYNVTAPSHGLFGPREIRTLHPEPGINKYGPMAATHHDDVQRPIECVLRQEHVVEPSRPVVSIGAEY